MLKKTIAYTDYNGEERKEDFYFNLSKAELVMMESSVVGGMRQRLEKIVQSRDEVSIMEMFKDLIHRSYGVKSDDGKRFIKSEELATQFEQTEAYSELVMEILSGADAAANFINSIIPRDIAKEIGSIGTDISALSAG